MPPKQLDLIPHNSIFTAAELILVMSYQDSHRVIYEALSLLNCISSVKRIDSETLLSMTLSANMKMCRFES
jgi:hypothetical protein